MIDSHPLITTIVASVVFAFLLGFAAHRAKLPTILGYIIAGILLGSHTPGFVANIDLAKQLAEIGIILLMFGVGLHFSIHDLISANRIALPGAFIQIISITFLSATCSMFLGYNLLESLIFGLALSVASTVVLLRALAQYKFLEERSGKIAVSWLIIEDIVMVVAVVILPAVVHMISQGSGGVSFENISKQVLLVLIKISIFVVLMLLVGRKILPVILREIVKTKSYELMSLGVLAIACGFAFIAYNLFGTSFALGAFVAGLVLNESRIGKKMSEQSYPLRDVFAVLFFTSVGMLFDPKILAREPFLVVITLLIVIFAKSFFAYLIMRFFRQDIKSSLVVSVSLAQVGEFSFIITALALKLGIFSTALYDVVIASSLLSIIINPLLFKIAEKISPKS
jgi:CPA2 family monovalent cation:H+ antiporter-2